MNNLGNDEDIKIAPEKLSELFNNENPIADDNIDLFIKQRSLGNTHKARVFGREMVADLLDCVWTNPPDLAESHEFENQLKILFAYIVHRIIEDYSPNTIVSNAAVSSFYETLEEADYALFQKISKSPAFSLYLYLHRSGEENSQSVGKTFAGLCSNSLDEQCCSIGETAYCRYMGACANKLASVGYDN